MKDRSICFRLFLCFVSLSIISFSIVSASEPIKILSINVRLSTGKDGSDAWPNRRDFLMDVVRSEPYDFIGGQEVVIAPENGLNQFQFMSEKLPEYGSVFRSRETNELRGEGTPVFYRKDRWIPDAEEIGVYWLSDTPEVPGSITWAGQSKCPRIVTGGLFHERSEDGKNTGKSIYFYSTHFDHVGEIARQKAADLILQRIAARKDKTIPVILVGDFNAAEASPTIRFLKGETVSLDGEEKTPPLALLDTFRVMHPDAVDVATFQAFKPHDPKKPKIDYIFITPELKTRAAEIIRTRNAAGRYPSDHYPVSAIVEF